jgi:hypothetical protein
MAKVKATGPILGRSSVGAGDIVDLTPEDYHKLLENMNENRNWVFIHCEHCDELAKQPVVVVPPLMQEVSQEEVVVEVIPELPSTPEPTLDPIEEPIEDQPHGVPQPEAEGQPSKARKTKKTQE